MKVGIKQLTQCVVILLKTSTTPKKDWLWMIASIFLTVLRNPNSILDRSKKESKKQFLSDYLPHRITVRGQDGILFMARPKYEDLARFLFARIVAKWEPLSVINPNENEVIIDVGANVGYYTLRLAPKVGKNGKIIAIEPDPESCELLGINCKLNSLSNVEIHNIAIADKTGDVVLYQSRTHSGTNSIFTNSFSDLESNRLTVKSTTLDNLLGEKYNAIDWIKIDVEGAELAVLRGSPKTLKITKNILIEVHEHILKLNNERPECVLEILKNNGFRITLINDNWDSETSPNQTLKCDYILGEKSS